MKLIDFLDARGLELEITRYPNQDERWSVRIPSVEISFGDRTMLRGGFGDGNNPSDATASYCKQIEGCELKLDGQYFTAPKSLEFP